MPIPDWHGSPSDWSDVDVDENGKFIFPADRICPECKGTGLRDSGGVYPWGEAIMLACDCGSSPGPGTQQE
jgi:hypothetical protein